MAHGSCRRSRRFNEALVKGLLRHLLESQLFVKERIGFLKTPFFASYLSH
jgi:hypothetical protein